MRQGEILSPPFIVGLPCHWPNTLKQKTHLREVGCCNEFFWRIRKQARNKNFQSIE